MARKLYASFKVSSRYLVRLLEDYASLIDVGQANDDPYCTKASKALAIPRARRP
ncbi:hypothetical protein [Mycobacterium sp. IS-836]|uniref:hypothetical protein n=1 Tax=Mycobacterium sp. IS-836 TaxID=1834160 RepID=UPI00130197CB|nr:hypothetical protein [Mycobacterium sp. IS-836]